MATKKAAAKKPTRKPSTKPAKPSAENTSEVSERDSSTFPEHYNKVKGLANKLGNTKRAKALASLNQMKLHANALAAENRVLADDNAKLSVEAKKWEQLYVDAIYEKAALDTKFKELSAAFEKLSAAAKEKSGK